MFGDTPLIIVEDRTSLLEAVEQLSKAPVLGVDTESDSFHHYQEKVCLIQISDTERDYIIDPLKVPDLTELGPLFSNPDTVKVLHGADYDIVSLQRDFGFRFTNMFDTMLAAQFLAMPRIGLADLIGYYFGHKIDKKYQRHDWAKRPLYEEHLHYARGDTHWLPALREVLGIRLDQKRRTRALAEECALLEEREWTGRVADPSVFLRVKGSKELDLPSKKVLRAVWELRDAEARDRDRPAFKVMPDTVLMDLARSKPQDMDALAAHFKRGSSLLRRHGDDLLAAVAAGMEDERPIPKRSAKTAGRKKRSSSSSNGAGIDRLLGPLKSWRNTVVDREGLNPVVVANNTLLKEIAREAPADIQALKRVPGIRKWQVRSFGEELVAVVAANQQPAKAPSRRRRRRRSGEDGGSEGGED